MRATAAAAGPSAPSGSYIVAADASNERWDAGTCSLRATGATWRFCRSDALAAPYAGCPRRDRRISQLPGGHTTGVCLAAGLSCSVSLKPTRELRRVLERRKGGGALAVLRGSVASMKQITDGGGLKQRNHQRHHCLPAMILITAAALGPRLRRARIICGIDHEAPAGCAGGNSLVSGCRYRTSTT